MHRDNRPRKRMTVFTRTSTTSLTLAAGGTEKKPDAKPGPVVEHKRPGSSSYAEMLKRK